MGIPATRLPSNYSGHIPIQIIPNEEMNVQKQGKNQNAGEGCSKLYKVVLDSDGQEIDLNKRYFKDKDIDQGQD